MRFLTTWDFVLLPFFIIIPFLFARRKRNRKIEKEPIYKYFVSGLMVKIIGGIGVCLIYCFYYDGGDTIAYQEGAVAMTNLIFKDFSGFVSLLLNNRTPENWALFDSSTTFPPFYMYRDTLAFSVIRLTSLISLAGFQSLILTTIIISWLTYSGIWKLFTLFVREFPKLEKSLAIAILFMPSVVFWGSGMLKDSFTLSAAAWIIYSTFSLMRKREKIVFHFFIIIISSYIIISIKPYIFFALLIGIIIVISQNNIAKIKSAFLRIIILPILLLTLWGGAALLFIGAGEVVGGHYSSIDNMLEKAVISQQDLSREYYGENTFNIGEFEPTIPGILSKFFPAMVAGLYRPFIFECTNPVMMISGFENTALLLFTLYVLLISFISLYRNGPKYMFTTLFDHPLIIFAFIFGFSFAFMVGLTTANFGALVRYKIPLIPFFFTSLIIIVHKFNAEKLDLENKKL